MIDSTTTPGQIDETDSADHTEFSGTGNETIVEVSTDTGQEARAKGGINKWLVGAVAAVMLASAVPAQAEEPKAQVKSEQHSEKDDKAHEGFEYFVDAMAVAPAPFALPLAENLYPVGRFTGTFERHLAHPHPEIKTTLTGGFMYKLKPEIGMWATGGVSLESSGLVKHSDTKAAIQGGLVAFPHKYIELILRSSIVVDPKKGPSNFEVIGEISYPFPILSDYVKGFTTVMYVPDQHSFRVGEGLVFGTHEARIKPWIELSVGEEVWKVPGASMIGAAGLSVYLDKSENSGH